MRVSVIMGAYNAEKTISRAIDSILNQSYSDWIFIICDDGSKDGTYKVLTDYKKRFPNKFVILKNEPNKGLTHSLNKCLKYATSEYVARMDADDVSLPNRFERQIAFLDNNPEYAFVGTAIERFDEDGVWSKTDNINIEPSKEHFYKSSGFVHPSVVIRKAALDSVGYYREAWFTNRCEDYDLWMRLYANGYKGYNLKDVLFQYYEGKESFPKRKYKYRICEAVTRAKGYAALKMYPKGLIYIMKPLVSGFIPPVVIKYIHSHK